jgi:hypothetical protein
MHQAVHVANPSLARNIRRVLQGFHSQKKQKGVDELLLRLYEPILWRSLVVANPAARRNSAALLFAGASFPGHPRARLTFVPQRFRCKIPVAPNANLTRSCRSSST